jgi:hypothetical protein
LIRRGVDMGRFFCVVAFLIALCSCGVPAEIRSALAVQTRHTRHYVEATTPLLQLLDERECEELEGVGMRLIRNAEALSDWAEGSEKQGVNGEMNPTTSQEGGGM